jgi:hypothetical protein
VSESRLVLTVASFCREPSKVASRNGGVQSGRPCVARVALAHVEGPQSMYESGLMKMNTIVRRLNNTPAGRVVKCENSVGRGPAVVTA